MLALWVRGTGASLDDDNFARSFLDDVSSALSGLTVAWANLGDTAVMPVSQYGNPYPAGALDYGPSRDTGVKELFNYLEMRAAICPNEKIVLGGYSQGADVVGSVLPSITPIESHIAYVALFGDTHFNGGTKQQCQDHNRPAWVCGDSDCNVNLSGVFDARNPYLPRDFQGKTGSWCLHADPGCQGNRARMLTIVCNCTPHSQYPSTAMGDAAHPGALYGKASTAWAELGNLDGNGNVDPEKNEYPAVPVD